MEMALKFYWFTGGVEELRIYTKLLIIFIISGFDIHAFDAPAHGMSSSLTTTLPEFVSCIEEISKKIDPLSFLIGHSGGGFASIYAASKNLKIKKLILISPFDSVLDLFKTILK